MFFLVADRTDAEKVLYRIVEGDLDLDLSEGEDKVEDEYQPENDTNEVQMIQS